MAAQTIVQTRVFAPEAALNVEERNALLRIFQTRKAAQAFGGQSNHDLEQVIKAMEDPEVFPADEGEDLDAAITRLRAQPHSDKLKLPCHVFMLQVVKAGILVDAAKLIGYENLYRTTVGAGLRFIPQLALRDTAAIKRGMDPTVSLDDWLRVIAFIGEVADKKLLTSRTGPDQPLTIHQKVVLDMNCLEGGIVRVLQKGVRGAEFRRVADATWKAIDRSNEELAIGLSELRGKPTCPFRDAVGELGFHLRKVMRAGLDARGIEILLDRVQDRTGDRLAAYLSGLDRGGMPRVSGVPKGCSEVACNDLVNQEFQMERLTSKPRRRHRTI